MNKSEPPSPWQGAAEYQKGMDAAVDCLCDDLPAGRTTGHSSVMKRRARRRTMPETWPKDSEPIHREQVTTLKGSLQLGSIPTSPSSFGHGCGTARDCHFFHDSCLDLLTSTARGERME